MPCRLSRCKKGPTALHFKGVILLHLDPWDPKKYCCSGVSHPLLAVAASGVQLAKLYSSCISWWIFGILDHNAPRSGEVRRNWLPSPVTLVVHVEIGNNLIIWHRHFDLRLSFNIQLRGSACSYYWIYIDDQILYNLPLKPKFDLGRFWPFCMSNWDWCDTVAD